MIAPGDIVFARSKHSRCSTAYEVEGDRARLAGNHDTFSGMGLIIAVIARDAKGLSGRGLICLYLPKSQQFIFTWETQVRKDNDATH